LRISSKGVAGYRAGGTRVKEEIARFAPLPSERWLVSELIAPKVRRAQPGAAGRTYLLLHLRFDCEKF
jgi:hypothetical protein